ncbi:MAG: filamentous hemagglutinin family protein [Xanthobacteraceae bacterium]|nr:filamentous hemagglutinin family protein [Xanthobacteraceae bacterium]
MAEKMTSEPAGRQGRNEPGQTWLRRWRLRVLATTALTAIVGAAPPAFGVYLLRGASNPGATAASQAAQSAASASAQAAAAKQAAAMAAAAQAIQAAQSRNSIAHSTYLLNLSSNGGAAVPNGNAPGGLVLDPNSTQTVGISGMTQTTSGNTVIDTIKQTQAKAVIDWTSFNIGANTELDFVQSSPSWSVLNRVTGSSANPSQILGHINATGGVYIINQNGIIFGPSAQINVGSLIASSLDVGGYGMTEAQRNAFYLTNGIASQAKNAANTAYLDSFSSTLAPTGGMEGNVTVLQGASITAVGPGLSSGSPGFIYLFAPNVENDGILSAPAGEVGLVAARAVALIPNVYAPTTNEAIGDNTAASAITNIRGTGFAITPDFITSGVSAGTAAQTYQPNTGSVINSGIISTPAGVTILNGYAVAVAPTGVISADTSISRNSQVFLDAVASVNLAGTISIQPLDNGDTPLPWGGNSSSSNGSTVVTFTPPSIEMSAVQVNLASTSLISAPGASVAAATTTQNFGAGLSAGASSVQQITMGSGATIDVSGLENVQLAADYNIVTFKVTGTELANDPLQRSGLLNGQYISVDIRNTGTNADGSTWIGTPVADASGYVAQVSRSIEQLLTAGGNVSFSTSLTTAGSRIVLSPGASINVAGGSVSYQSGYVPNTRLIGSDGHVYDISQANPNLTYVGIVGEFVTSDARWGAAATRTYISKFNQVYEPGYVEGYSAGSISIQGASVAGLGQANFQFGAIVGQRQAALGEASGTAVAYAVEARDLIPSQGGLTIVAPESFVITDGSPSYSGAAFQPGTSNVIQVSASQLNGYGLSSLSITGNDLYIPAGTTVAMASGGTFSATTAGAIDVEGTVAARGGQISLTTEGFSLRFADNLYSYSVNASGQSDITVGGTLDVRGLWVNDTGLTAATETGPGFINGGAITLQTLNGTDASGAVNRTGNITLTAGSLLDASSGGYVNTKGVAKTTSSGTLAGNGGNISLAVFQGAGFTGLAGSPDPLESGAHDSIVTMDGTVRSYGFATGGTLTISTPSFQIGGTPSGDPNTLYLPTAFFTQNGFASYVLQTPNDTQIFANFITVAPNQTVTLQQQNFASNGFAYTGIGTGANVTDFAPLVTLPGDQRKPVNLTLQTGVTSTGSSAGSIALDAGSTIATDPGAKVTLDVTNAASSLQVSGSITDHGGTVIMEAYSVQLGAGSVIDLSGTFIPSSTFGTFGTALQSGTLLAGGTLTIDTTKPGGEASGSAISGSVTAAAGAVVDVSGAAATIEGYDTTTPVRETISVASWSDAGTVNINTGSLNWNGKFKAEAGGPQGNRGTLNLGGNTISLVSSMSNLAGASTSTIIAAADQLAAFDTVYLYAGAYDPANALTGGSGFISAALPGAGNTSAKTVWEPLQVYGNVDLTVRNRLLISALAIVDQTPTGGAGVNFAANYVLLSSNPASAPPLSSGQRNLTISGQTIDVQSAAFSNFLNVTLASSGDIRLMAPPVNDGVNLVNGTEIVNASTGSSAFFGELATGGNLTLSAQRIYPATAVDFAIDLTGSLGTVTFTAPAGSNTSTPLSAGGSLTVSAATIIQDGNLFAPLGTISLGTLSNADRDPNDHRTAVVTQSVTLGAGSLTSVSLAGQIVPYGQTEDGTNWFYNAPTSPLTGPPTKAVLLKGGNITVAAGSNLNISGGGDLQSFEWVSGKGGTKDVLSDVVQNGTTYTSASSTVYAILPSGSQASVAAYDIDFNSYLGDKEPLAGQQVYLSGGAGLAAGWYTLYPAHYATLPGAYRVVDYGSSLANPGLAVGTTLPDGTVIMGGAYGQSSLGLRASGTELFSVESSSVWQQYTQFTPSSANTYFTASAGHVASTQVLPIDGGRLSIAASVSLVLSGTINSQAAAGGTGGELDISSAKVDIIDSGTTALAGYVGIQASEIDSAGFESVLIGGFRTDQSNGTTLITPTATDVRVDLSTTPLTAPEVILVAAPAVASGGATASYTVTETGTATAPAAPASFTVPAFQPGTGNVTIASGVVTANGSTGADTGRRYVLGSSSLAALASQLGGTLTTSTSGGPLITGVTYASSVQSTIANFMSGNAAGALFLASNAPGASVTRNLLPAGGVKIQFQSLSPTTTNTYYYTLSLPTSSPGTLTVGGNGQSVTAGAAPGSSTQPKVLILSATGQTGAINVQPGAVVGAQSVTVAAPSIGIGDSSGTADSVVLGHDLMAQLTQGSLTLQALSGNIDLYTYQNLPNCAASCQIGIGDGVTLQNLTLDAGAIVGHGFGATIDAAGTVTLVNSGVGAASAADATFVVNSQSYPGGHLAIAANEIDLAGGNSSINGYTEVDLIASQQVFVKGAGSLTLGATGSGATPVNLVMLTPNLLVGTATTTSSSTTSQFALTTQGNLLLRGDGSAPAATSQIGGSIAITAASIELDQASIEALSGTISLHATGSSNAGRTSGNILLGDSSYLAAGGYARTLIDQIRYSSGGHVSLTSDNGDIVTSATGTIDVSQPAGGLASGGEIDITAQNGNLVSTAGVGVLASRILGVTYGAANGATGGIFHLDIGGGLANNSLDGLVDSLTTGGFTNEVSIETRTGGLVLDNVGLGAGQMRALTASIISLTADSTDPILGRVVLGSGTKLDASGNSGGTIEIYARSVDVEGVLDAHATGAGQAGGSVTIGTRLTASRQYDATYGFEIVSVQDNPATGFLDGMLTLGSTFSVNLSGMPDSSGNVRNGTLTLRAPLIETAATGGTPQYSVRINTGANPQTALVGVAAVALDVYATWSTTDNTTGAQHFDGIIDPAGTTAALAGANHKAFYDNTLVNFTQNALSQLVDQPSLSPITAFGTSLPVPLILSPGVVLQNPSMAVNNGDITVASAWNLAAGVIVNPVSGKFSQSASDILFAYRFGYCVPSCTAASATYYDAPGNLTLQAVRNINVNASISDGFFDTENLSGVTSTSATQQVVGSIPSGAPTALSTATFTAIENALLGNLSNPNGFSPTVTTANPGGLAGYDLFPSTLNLVVQTPGGASSWATTTAQPRSWSYRLTAGADFSSANPNAVGTVATYGDGATGALAGQGNVIVNGHTTYSYKAGGTFSSSPTLTIALPTMLRTGTGDIIIDAARDVVLADTSAPGVIYSAGVNAQLPSGFTPPNLFYAGDATSSVTPYDELLSETVGGVTASVKLAGPTTAPAFPVDGGDIVIRAQQDIIGFQNVFATANYALGASLATSNPAYQFYAPWLLVQASGSSGDGAYVTTGSQYERQTAWWIEYGRFDQGVMSAGGNVTVVAGRDLRDFSVSLPTTGAVSGGQTSTSLPQVTLYGSGNMVIRVGRNLDSGSFYEGSGTATITVGGSVQSDWTGAIVTNALPVTTVPVSVSTVLAVDTGSINLTAAGSITITDILNPAQIHGVSGTTMVTYGPNSTVGLTSIGGDVTVNSTPALISNGITPSTAQFVLPAVVNIEALSGNITTPQAGMTLFDSPSASLSLLAYGSVNLIGGGTTAASNPSGTIGAGTALVDQAFNPYEPNLWPGNTALGSTTPVLAHASDSADNLYDLIYAATGSITGGQADIEIPRPVLVKAGLDIVDLNLTAQNIRTSDVSQIIAGRDITYDAFSVSNAANTGGGLQIAGPGFLDVEAGRNLGPFLVASADGSKTTYTQQGIVSSGNAATFDSVISSTTQGPVSFPVGNNLYTAVGYPSTIFLGAVSGAGHRLGTQNFLLPSTGATIVALFGVAPSTDYLGFVQVHYADLKSFLGSRGYPVTSATSESVVVSMWSTLSLATQQAFLAQADPSLTYVGLVTAFADATVTNLSTLQAFLVANGSTVPSGASAAQLVNVFSGLSLGLQQQFVHQITPAIDYSAVVTRYLDPTTAVAYSAGTSGVYLADLVTFLDAHGYPAVSSTAAAWSTWSQIPSSLQHMFLDQVFFSEIQRAANQTTSAIGYTAVDTMFPIARGYTDNATTGTLGAPTTQLVSTGALNLLHATIQTDYGGDVDIFGPGGSIKVGSLAIEPNSNLKLNNLGLITEGGGDINTFTDGSVLVNASRVFTEQGGSILMWTSNGDLNAGEGSRTTLSLNALQVFIDNNDFQSINRGGLVTGAGIATLASSADVPAGNITLLAPNGIIDTGDAGIRATGIFDYVSPVPPVGTGGVQASGGTKGGPALSSQAFTGDTNVNTNQANTHVGPDTTASTTKSSQPSVIIVNIVGYGGGDNLPTGSVGGTGGATGSTGGTNDNAAPAGSGQDNDTTGGPGNTKRRDGTSG